MNTVAQAFYIEIPFILDNHGFDAKDIGVVIVITGTGFIFGAFLSGFFARSLKVSWIVATSIIISILVGLLCVYQVLNYHLCLFLFAAWVIKIGVGMSDLM